MPGVEAFLSSGRRELGAFHLIEALGKGGFAPVWRATEKHAGDEFRDVAVKLFTIADAASRKAVLDEARALCRVEHPNVVRFYTFTEDAGAHVFGLVMEYVRGTPLDRRLEAGKLDAGAATTVGIAVASALVAVHAVGIVHRDVKPANVVEAGGVFKVIDFGIASLATKPRARSVAAPIVLDDLPIVLVSSAAATLVTKDDPAALEGTAGTIGYLDPSCVSRLRPADALSDVYSLGATLYECLTGAIPAIARNRALGLPGLSGEVLDGRAAPPPVREVEANVPERLARLVDRMVAPEPSSRPASAADVLAELEAIAAARVEGAAAMRVESVTAAAPKPRSRWTLAAILVVPVVASAAWLALRPARAPYVMHRLDEEVDFRKWVPYTDERVRTSPVFRHVHVEAERLGGAVPFLDYAGTTSPLGLECTTSTRGATCVETSSIEPGRRSYEIRLPAELFVKNATIDYDVVSYNVYPFDENESQLSHVTRRFEAPADEYHLTIRFPPGRTYAWMNVVERLEGSSAPAKTRRIDNVGRAAEFKFDAREVPVNYRYRFDIRLESGGT